MCFPFASFIFWQTCPSTILTDDWAWEDGTDYGSYENWNENEPSPPEDGEHCVELYTNGKWNDLMCHNQRGYICKVKQSKFTISFCSLSLSIR